MNVLESESNLEIKTLLLSSMPGAVGRVSVLKDVLEEDGEAAVAAAAAIVLSEGSPRDAPLVGDRRVGCAMSIRRGSDG